MDIQLAHRLSKIVCWENVCVDIVKERNVADTSDIDTCNDANVKNITAQSLLSLLSGQLGKKAFYFVSGQQKHVPNGNLCNGVISCTKETIDFELVSNTNRSNSTGSDDCSMFGSPLKLQTIANLSVKTSNTTLDLVDLQRKQDFASPIPLRDARKILSKFTQAKIQDSSVNMMVVFCDGNDLNRTILLGEQIESADDGKALTTFRVNVDKIKLPDLEESLAKKEQGCQLTAKYRVLDKLDGLGSIVLEARWSDPLGRMKLTKLQSAEFILQVDVASGSDQSPVFNHHCQLQKVHTLLEGLKTGELPEVLSQKTQKAVILLKEAFTKMKDGVAAGKSVLSNEDSKSTSIVGMLCGTARQLNLESSADGDFTDILWQIIRNCTDISDLIQCLNTTFIALKKGDLKVFVHKANQTTIAKLVRQSYCGMASFPCLNGHLSLRLATEIGLEKIRKDYYTVFINNSLCTLSQWNSFFETLVTPQEEVMDMEELDIQSLEAQFSILSKLHHCLEIVSVVDSFTESQDLKSITKHVMNCYKCRKFDQSPSFTIPITALQASPEIKKHPLFSIKRESFGTGECNVISLISELPDELPVPSLSALQEAGDVTFVGDSREYFMFRSQEHTLHIDCAEFHA